MTARCRRGENPVGRCGPLAHVENALNALAGGDRAPRSAALPFVDHDEAIAEVLPFQPEALLGSQSAIEQDRGYVPEDVGIRSPRLLTALNGADAFEGSLVGLLDVVPDLTGCVEVCGLFFEREDPLTMVFS